MIIALLSKTISLLHTFNKGNTLANLNRYKDAIDCYKKTFEFEAPDALTYYNIGECYEQLEDPQRARDTIKRKRQIRSESGRSLAWNWYHCK